MNKTFIPENKAQKTILAKLTFGFEIEGLFDSSLQELSEVKSQTSDFGRGTFQEDGSVHTDDAGVALTGDKFDELAQCGARNRQDCDECEGRGYNSEGCDCIENGNYNLICKVQENTMPEEGEEYHDHTDDIELCYELVCDEDDELHEVTCYVCNGDGYYSEEDEGDAEEFASPVFNNLDDALTMLARFNKKTHEYNQSCGLHFHIGAKTEKDARALWTMASNIQLLQRIHDEALKYCPHQKERTTNVTRFCEMFKSGLQLVHEFKTSEKYRFVRFHEEYNTLEFRFLSPCEHKVENVKKLIATILDFATTKENIHIAPMVEDATADAGEFIEFSVKERSAGDIEQYNNRRDNFIELINEARRDIVGDYEYYISNDRLSSNQIENIDYEVMRNFYHNNASLRDAIDDFADLWEGDAYLYYRNWLSNGDNEGSFVSSDSGDYKIAKYGDNVRVTNTHSQYVTTSAGAGTWGGAFNYDAVVAGLVGNEGA